MKRLNMGQYTPFADMGKTCLNREITAKSVVWPVMDEKVEAGFRHRRLRRADINEISELWRQSYPEIYGSTNSHSWILYPEEYEENVALEDNWEEDCRKKKYYMPVMEDASTGRIVSSMLCAKDDMNLQIKLLVGFIHPEYRKAATGFKIISVANEYLEQMGQASGAEYITTFAETWHSISQYLVRSWGWKIAGIFPGEYTRWRGGDQEYRGCTVHFYKFVGKGEQYATRPDEWSLLPEIRKLWDTLEEINNTRPQMPGGII